MLARFAGALLATSALAAAAVPAATHATTVPDIFAGSVKRLRVVAFPVLLPTKFDSYDLWHDHFFVTTEATRHSYSVRLDLIAGCEAGQNVCSAGNFEADDGVYRRAHGLESVSTSITRIGAEDRAAIRAGREILNQPTALAGGLTGHYTEFVSGAADGGNSSLEWSRDGIDYIVYTRLSHRSELVRTANSAIRNGPLFRTRN